MLGMLDCGTYKTHYFRAGRAMSWAAALAMAATAGWAQYPGQVAKPDVSQVQPLRAVAVLEWTGEAGKPKKARLIPVTIFDGADLQDGTIYLARPQPLGLSSEVEYELRKTGKNIGLFDIENAGQEQGLWVGYGKWKPMPPPKKDAPKPVAMFDENYDDKPVLHRKHHTDDKPETGGAAKDTKDSGEPTLHRKDADADTAADESAPDPDRPTLRRPKKAETSSGDPDRPKLKKDKKAEDVGYVENVAGDVDPDRPRLKRGKSEGNGLQVVPSLMGLPPDLQQAVAVSDERDRPEHPWVFHWSNPKDELDVKAKLEAVARTALGLDPPPDPAAKPAAKSRTARARKHMTLPPPEPAPLADEQFRVFELAYGAGATLVLSAHTDATAAEQKYLTLIAQPDFYGGLQILLKNVADARHLDDTPRLRLVDAVDAEADNRAELLFEARGATERHFVLYRVLRGRAEAVFTGPPASYVAVSQ
jgi:hypothetical protein